MQAKGNWVFLIVRTVLAFLSEGLRAGRGKTKHDNKQMKHMMDSFEAWNNFKKMAKSKTIRKNGTKLNLK